MNFDLQIARIRAGHADSESLGDLARAALGAGEEEHALPILRAAARRGRDARLWQWTGLLERALDAHAAALESFAEAARLAPSDRSIAHGRARTAFEAGIDARPLFELARRLDPANGEVLTGLAAARVMAGQADEAEAELDAVLVQSPLWLDGHVQLAQLRATLGHPERATVSLERALSALPGEPALWRSLFGLRVRAENYEALEEALAAAGRGGHVPLLRAEYAPIAAAELGRADHADACFSAAPAEAAPRLAVWRIRHLLRSARAREALPLIDRELASDRAASIWPYAASAWRLTNDSRSVWLEGDPRLIAVAELGTELPDLAELAALLRKLHVAKGEYLDQSIRGGTQTDGPLFSRIEPEIRMTRAAIVRAVQAYVAQLPPPDPAHPLLGRRRDRRIRFAGSWSVRLRGSGFHSNHVHPQGWVSSALYIGLPHRDPGDISEAGWLSLGAPQAALGLNLAPHRRIEPGAARLALFPSWMWHGTLPFAAGERLTIAFDVAPPL